MPTGCQLDAEWMLGKIVNLKTNRRKQANQLTVHAIVGGGRVRFWTPVGKAMRRQPIDGVGPARGRAVEEHGDALFGEPLKHPMYWFGVGPMSQ